MLAPSVTDFMLGRHHMSESRTIPLALVAATVGMIGCLWGAWCEFPFYAWNEMRLAPAFAIRHGLNPYPPVGGGPLTTWIYGPVGALLNLPATFAPTVDGALHAACVINALTVLGPLALIFFTATELRNRGPLVTTLALTIAALFIPRPNLVLQVADHSAIACGLLSCWCLARPTTPSQAWLAGAAVLCATAIWSKQVELFLLPAQLAYLWIGAGRPTAGRYLAWVALFVTLGLAAFTAAFGFENLWLNLVAIPGRLGWAAFWPRLLMRPWSLIAQVIAPTLGLLVLWRARRWPGRESASGRFFQITAFAFITMLPIGLAAYFKIGGDTNLLHSWQYLLPGATLVWLAHDRTTAAVALRLPAIVACGLLLRGKDLVAPHARPFTGHFAVAADLMRAHPHTLWFPQNPLITFYADGRLWHSEDGIATRHLAGYGLREIDFRRHLPSPRLEGVVYPIVVEFPFAMPLLPEFNQKMNLPHWTLHRRNPSTPPAVER